MQKPNNQIGTEILIIYQYPNKDQVIGCCPSIFSYQSCNISTTVFHHSLSAQPLFLTKIAFLKRSSHFVFSIYTSTNKRKKLSTSLSLSLSLQNSLLFLLEVGQITRIFIVRTINAIPNFHFLCVFFLCVCVCTHM